MTMFAENQRIEDNRRSSVVAIEAHAFSLVAILGPAAWTVYTFLLYSASRPSRSVPSLETLARSCGIPRPEVEAALQRLEEHGLLRRDRERTSSGEQIVYRILPAARSIEQPQQESRPQAEPAEFDTAVEESPSLDLKPAQPDAPPEVDDETIQWKRRIEEKRLARQLFSSFVNALGDQDQELTDQERDRIRTASEIVGEAGATPEQVRIIAERIRQLQPRAGVDPIWIAEHWAELTRDLFNNEEYQAS